MKDYYQILNIPESADDKEVKKAYHTLAREWHPDKHQNKETFSAAEEKFKEISEAYSILSDPQKRQQYDISRRGGSHQFFTTGDMDSVFAQMFGIRRQAPPNPHQPRAGQTVELQHELKLVEALLGTEKEINYRTISSCDECNGLGGKEFEVCSDCKGQGSQTQIHGNMFMQSTCPTCRGQGKKIKVSCLKCLGRSILEETRTVTVRFPPGLKPGITLRINGAGGRGANGGPTGELLIHIFVAYPSLTSLSEDEKSELRTLLSK